MIDLTQYLSSITLKTAEKRLFWAFLKPIWVLKGIKIIFFTIISLYNDFWGQTKPLTTPNRDRLDTPHIIPYVQWLQGCSRECSRERAQERAQERAHKEHLGEQ